MNDKGIAGILENAAGQNVLDVACGKGFLSHLLANNGFRVVACDFLNTLLPQFEHPEVEFIQGDITSLNFIDGQFDTVISAHTLEHVEDIFSAVNELRRVAKKRIILVLPKQRPCKFTFDFHIHFFPYSVTLLSVLGAKGRNYRLDLLGGDWFYVEEI